MVDLTIEEACSLLDPPLSPQQLRQLVTVASLQPVGRRQIKPRGRPANTYDATEIFRLHQVLAPFLTPH